MDLDVAWTVGIHPPPGDTGNFPWSDRANQACEGAEAEQVARSLQTTITQLKMQHTAVSSRLRAADVKRLHTTSQAITRAAACIPARA